MSKLNMAEDLRSSQIQIKNRGEYSPLFFLRFRALTLIFIAFLVSCGGDDSSWTVLVYMDGDNDLDQAALADIAEMEAIGSSDYINIIVQLDLRAGITTKRYHILKGSKKLISDLGELDMASPQTITDFLIWAKGSYPAERTALILWNHGNGWDQGDGPSSPASGITSSSIFRDDDNNSRFLSNHQVKKAIKDSGIKLDILGLDACVMGAIEALYEFSELSEVIISSQEVGESSGWDYTSILSNLQGNPGMGAEEFSGIVVSSYKAFYEDIFYPSHPGYEKQHTISALRTNYIVQIAEETDLLATRLISLLKDPLTRDETLALINTARDSVQDIDFYAQPYVYVDLADLDRLLQQGTKISQLVSDATVAEYHGSARENAHGISIVFFKLPEAVGYTYDQNYKNYDPQTNTGNGGDFINQFSWDEFLQIFFTLSS